MTIGIHKRHAYDDVTLLASSDLEASRWQLEVRVGDGWLVVPPRLMDSHLNWSTPDLAHWEELRRGDAAVIKRVFPGVKPSIPAGGFEVMWDVSNWVYGKMSQPFRFTDPKGTVYEFEHRWDTPEHVFG